MYLRFNQNVGHLTLVWPEDYDYLKITCTSCSPVDFRLMFCQILTYNRSKPTDWNPHMAIFSSLELYPLHFFTPSESQHGIEKMPEHGPLM